MAAWVPNKKCVVQGALILSVWLLAANDKFPVDGRSSTPGTWAFALLLFMVAYWVNGILDVKMGCEHGEIIRSVANSF